VNGSGTVTGSTLSFATDPPATVTTGIASPVTTTTAQLNGTVNANSNSTTVTFEYGLTTSYGTTVTADQSPVTGSTDTAVSKAISGLTPNTTYHFRVVGVNALGTSNGEDKTFFTSAQTAPTATTEYATYNDVSMPNSANLNGTVNANNADATVTFEYGLTTAYGTTVTADQSPVLGSADTAVSKTISGLTADTTYHYRVVATNGIGTTNGADMTLFNTAAPYARTDAAIPIDLTTATLNGTVNPRRFDDSLDTTVTFEYGLTNAYGSSAPAIQSPLSGGVEQTVSLGLTGLTANTTYHYRVTATSPSGTGTGADMTFNTLGTPIVTTDTAAPVGTTTATLNGTVNANGNSTTVTFEYGTTTAYGTTVTADQSPVTGTTATPVSKAITGLTNATTYHYRVVGTNGSGTSNGVDKTFTTGVMPPTATTDAATAIGTTSATMNGTVNANGLNTTVAFEWGFTTAYGVTDSATPNVVAGSTNTPVAFSPGTLIPNTTYHYRVVAQSAGGTIFGADRSFTTHATPTVTTNIASSVTTAGAVLNGMVNAINQSTTVTFEYGTTTAYGTTVTADQSPVSGNTDTAVSKAISGLTLNTTYHYRVVGQNASGTSHGADRTFTTSAPAAPTATTNAATSVVVSGATLNGTVNANNNSTTVTFEYGTTVAYGTVVTADQSPVTGSSSTAVSKAVTGLSNNTTYHFRVVAQNGNGTTNGADMTFTTGALTPSVTTGAATNVLHTSATINGTANGNAAGAIVTFDYGLTVAYGTSISATPSTVPGDQTDYAVSANLSALTPGTTYHYRAVADNIFVTPVNGADMTFTTPIGPDVTTDAATSVTANNATLHGTVNANNASTTVTFEYGLTASYGKTVGADQSPVTGNTNTAVSTVLASLVPNTTYHYRTVVVNANGTSQGVDMTFTTPALAPTVVTAPASLVGITTATLNGTVNANSLSTTVTFEYGTTTAYGTTETADQSPVTGSSTTAVNKALTGLTPNTTYHYRVVGQNGAGTSNGGDMTFLVGAPVAGEDFAKAFDGPSTAGGTPQLIFTLQNLDPINSLSGLSFTDDLDAVITGLQATGVASNTCGGSLNMPTASVTFSGGSLAANASCNIVLDLLVPASATAGTFPNTTSDLFQSGLKVADLATADLVVEPPPTFAKVFAPDSSDVGQVSTLTFTIDNSASAVAAGTLAFSDTLPAGVEVATPPVTTNSCGGSLTATAGASMITFSGGSVGAGATCTVDVDVTATAAGGHVNTSGDLTSSSGNSGTATDTLTVANPTLTVAAAGVGNGTVTGTGISCTATAGVTGGDCDETAAPGTMFALMAAVSAGEFTMWSSCDSVSGASGEVCNVTLTINTTVTVAFSAVDGDGDGVAGLIENLVSDPDGLGTGDGNGDMTADRLQRHVTSLPNFDGTHRVTFANAAGHQQEGFSTGPRPGDAPSSVDTPLGLFGFRLTGVPVGGTVTMTLDVPAELGISGYFKRNGQGTWVNIATNVATNGNKTRITFPLSDGGEFDGNPAAGVIDDPGLPGLESRPIPTLNLWGQLLLGILLVLLLWQGRARRV
ncbi:MAG: hypothetical protein GY797_14300, partial [Deltaproteobacteria bacterium]|nr:hypothetical protein [Deltaproteobacteria bacterium]